MPAVYFTDMLLRYLLLSSCFLKIVPAHDFTKARKQFKELLLKRSQIEASQVAKEEEWQEIAFNAGSGDSERANEQIEEIKKALGVIDKSKTEIEQSILQKQVDVANEASISAHRKSHINGIIIINIVLNFYILTCAYY